MEDVDDMAAGLLLPVKAAAVAAALQGSSTPTVPAAPDTSPTDHRQPRRTADICVISS
ncbi:hypothetical protein GCM10010304_77110 [Streptomyces roseoviolaceus]